MGCAGSREDNRAESPGPGRQQAAPTASGQVPQDDRAYLRQLRTHRVVGQGQSGTVSLVQAPDGTYYALKSIGKQHLVGKRVEQLRNEIAIGTAIKHASCVRTVRTLEDSDSSYLLLEWVPGGDLFRRIQNGAVPAATADFYAANVLLALEYLHSLGVVYRDLKPENVMIAADGYTKLADYGFAKRIFSGRSYTICGTTEYLAPEIISGDGACRASDLWSWGILLYELLVGDTPFAKAGMSDWEIQRSVLAGRFVVPPHVSTEHASLIRHLLDQDPERRPSFDTIKRHPCFAWIDWAAMAAHTVPAPWVPPLASPDDTSNFDDF